MFRDQAIATGQASLMAELAPGVTEGEVRHNSQSSGCPPRTVKLASSAHSPSRAGKAVRRQAAIALPAQECHVRTARWFATALLLSWQVTEDDQASALLIVSELAGNAAEHGRSEMAVHLALKDRALHIDVADSGEPASSPRARSGDADDEHGRGLSIVEFLADRTETAEDQGGRRVRTTLSISPITSRAA